jgi:hypothetical protein
MCTVAVTAALNLSISTLTNTKHLKRTVYTVHTVRYEQLSRICPSEEGYKLYLAQALFKVSTASQPSNG